MASVLDQYIFACRSLAPEMASGIEVLYSPPLFIPHLHNKVDWWPIYEIPERMNPARGNNLIYWDTKKGTIQTSKYLYNWKEDPQKQFGIWMSAWLHDYYSHTLIFNKSIYKLVLEIREELDGIDREYSWHHASRDAMPESICRGYEASTLFQVTKKNDLVFLMAIDTVFSFRGGRVVIYENQETHDV